MVRFRAQVFAALMSALVCGCAGKPVDAPPNLVSDMPVPQDSGVTTGALQTSGYQLSEEELKFDCKKLTGLMQIRILQVRGYDSNKKATAAARGIQSLATPIFGGTKEGVDPDGQYRKDLAMLQAFTNPVAQNFVGPSWSLTVECLCYLLFALAAYDGRRTLLRLTVGAILGGALWFALFGQSGGPWVIDIFPRGLLGFFLGQALWHGRERLAEVRWWLLALVFVIAFAMPTGGASPLLPLCLLAWPAALLLALRMSWLESRPMVWLGDRSYAIYLIHLPLIQAAGWAFGLLPPSPGLVVVGHVALIAATLILSDLALRWLEKPARSAIRGAWARRPLSFSRALG